MHRELQLWMADALHQSRISSISFGPACRRLCRRGCFCATATAILESSELLDSEDDWIPDKRPPPFLLHPGDGQQKRKKTTTRRTKKRIPPATGHEDNDMDVDEPKVKRKKATVPKKTARRRLNIDQEQTNAVESDEDKPTAPRPSPATVSRRRVTAPRTVSETPMDTEHVTAVTAVNRHHQSVQDFASGLSMEALQAIVVELLFRDQGAYQDCVLGYRPEPTTPDHDPSNSPDPDGIPRWCRCRNCRSMPTVRENKCCWVRRTVQCITEAPHFYTVVTPAVLELAMAHYNDFLAHDQERNNASFRHQAYRQFVLQRYGRCGHGNRHVVPSCVVLAIRRRFPDPRGLYTGFKPS